MAVDVVLWEEVAGDGVVGGYRDYAEMKGEEKDGEKGAVAAAAADRKNRW